jgi:AraC-like DNA-binding protein
MGTTGIQQLFSSKLGEIRYSEFRRSQLDFPQRPRLSFKYVLSGAEEYALDDQHYILQQGQALFFRDQKRYSVAIDSSPITRGLCIDLDLSMVQDASMDALQEDCYFLLDPAFESQKLVAINPKLHQLLHTMAKEHQAAPALYWEENLERLITLVLQLEKAYVAKIKEVPVQKPSYKKEVFARLLLAQNYIHDCMAENIQLEDIAQAAAISKFYLQRLFKQAFGCSPSAYLERVRMQKAQEMLHQQHAVKDTAYALGYSDAAYFCRRFKKHFGRPPGKFTAD